MQIRDQFVQTSSYKKIALSLLGVGLVALIVGIFKLEINGDATDKMRFWAGLHQNSVYFLLVVNASMFFVCASVLAMGGWITSFRRIPEAIGKVVPVMGTLTLIVLLTLVFKEDSIYQHWNSEHASHDKLIQHKAPFLNKTFYIIWTVLTIGLWYILGAKVRNISREADSVEGVGDPKKWHYKNSIWAALFLVWFGLTTASTTPWLWIMSIDAHWFSTMFSWYMFISSFVAGMSLVALYMIYLKNQGYLELTNEEHLHDVGKFMFAFSVFWTYLWFSQYMLIWYSNQPEETKHFIPQVKGAYKGLFFLNLILNFIAPLLILMKRGSKRNYSTITFMAIVIIFGHWIDYYINIMPYTVGNKAELSWYEFGLLAGFVGLIMAVIGRALEKAPLIPKAHPFIKESVIHHT
jgi:hypothetical protein